MASLHEKWQKIGIGLWLEACHDTSAIDLWYISHHRTDMCTFPHLYVLPIFADLDIVHWDYLHVCLHKNVTKSAEAFLIDHFLNSMSEYEELQISSSVLSSETIHCPTKTSLLIIKIVFLVITNQLTNRCSCTGDVCLTMVQNLEGWVGTFLWLFSSFHKESKSRF